MSIAELPITIDRAKIATFCREREIRRLRLFGSVLRADFDPARSDIDVLADFAPGALRRAGLDYFGYAEELSAIIGRPVDLCTKLHPYIAPRVDREALTIYEQA